MASAHEGPSAPPRPPRPLLRAHGQFAAPVALLVVLPASLALLAAAWSLSCRGERLLAAAGAVMAAFVLLPRCGRALGYRLPAAALVVLGCVAALVALALALLPPSAPAWNRTVAGLAAAWLACAVLCKLWIPLTGLRHQLVGGSGAMAGGPAGTLRVASWNVFLRVLVAESPLANDEKESRVGGIAAAAAATGADVICLQECNASFSYRAHRMLESLSAGAGYRFACVPRRPPLLSPSAWLDSGLVTASRLPIARAADCRLPAGVGADRLMAKGAQRAELAAPGWAICNTHLQADYALPGHRGCARTSRRRVRQLRALRRFAEGAAVLCGDLNDDRRPELRAHAGAAAEALGMRDPWQGGAPVAFRGEYDYGGAERRVLRGEPPSSDPLLRCVARSTDYILLGRGAREVPGSGRVLRGPPLSDHNALVLDVAAAQE